MPLIWKRLDSNQLLNFCRIVLKKRLLTGPRPIPTCFKCYRYTTFPYKTRHIFNRLDSNQRQSRFRHDALTIWATGPIGLLFCCMCLRIERLTVSFDGWNHLVPLSAWAILWVVRLTISLRSNTRWSFLSDLNQQPAHYWWDREELHLYLSLIITQQQPTC